MSVCILCGSSFAPVPGLAPDCCPFCEVMEWRSVLEEAREDLAWLQGTRAGEAWVAMELIQDLIEQLARLRPGRADELRRIANMCSRRK